MHLQRYPDGGNEWTLFIWIRHPEGETVTRRLPRPHRPHDYDARSKSQMLAWALGSPYHDHVIGECCPDFSCCYPDMFTKDNNERWRRYRERYAATGGKA